MSFFEKIKTAIFGHRSAPAGQAKPQAPSANRPAPAPQAAPAAAPAPSAPAPVDVEAVLTELAAAKGRPSNWRVSIVDLLQLLDLDSSLTARKELGQELGIHAGADGSAEQNIALHKA
ncbi:MAG: DUF3597 family protein, partial [Sphingomonadales bacterium]